MRNVSDSSGGGATNRADMQTDMDVRRTWFSEISQQLVPSNAGLVLHILTGCEERTCYRWAAGQSPVSGWFVRQLLRSEQGGTWLAAIMEGSTAPWWRELAAAQELCAKYKIELR